MKKLLCGLLVLLIALSLVGCSNSKTEESAIKEVSDVTVPEFYVKVCGNKVTEKDMSAYSLYEIVASTTNSQGTDKTYTYVGYKLSDIIKASGIEAGEGKITAIATDDFAVNYESNIIVDTTLVALLRDGESFKEGPWLAPCASKTTGDYLKNLNKIEIEGVEAKAEETVEASEEIELRDPDIADKTDKIVFTDFSFKVNGEEVNNSTLEGLRIYKANVTVENSKGKVSEVTYSGYLLKDVLDKLGINASSVKVVANDGYEQELDQDTVNSDMTLVAIEKDKAVSEDGSIWLAPCKETSSGKYAKGVIEIVTE